MAIIFDFDGVLHDTFEFHRCHIEKFAGIELSEQEFKDVHNENFNSYKHHGFRSVNWKEYEEFIYPSISHLRIEDKIKDAISKLSENHELYINSSGGTRCILSYLENNGIDSFFREVLGSDFHKSKVYKFRHIFGEYGLTSNDCIFIADTLGDILEAKKVEVRTIAVVSKYHNRETLEQGSPYRIISHLGELYGIINSDSPH